MNENFNELDNKIFGEIKEFIKEACSNNYIGDRLWTNKIKERLCSLGKSLEYQVAVGGFRDEYEKEWLYDITWYEEDSDNRLIRIPLIVESEWDKSYFGIKYDFEKLLVGNAIRRLMICQWPKSNLNELLDKFAIAIESFEENKGDTFLFAILDSESEEEFIFRKYTKS